MLRFPGSPCSALVGQWGALERVGTLVCTWSSLQEPRGWERQGCGVGVGEQHM